MRRRMLSALVCTGCLLRAADSDATDAQAKGFDPFNDKTLFGMEFSLEVPEDAESRYYVRPHARRSTTAGPRRRARRALGGRSTSHFPHTSLTLPSGWRGSRAQLLCRRARCPCTPRPLPRLAHPSLGATSPCP